MGGTLVGYPGGYPLAGTPHAQHVCSSGPGVACRAGMQYNGPSRHEDLSLDSSDSSIDSSDSSIDWTYRRLVIDSSPYTSRLLTKGNPYKTRHGQSGRDEARPRRGQTISSRSTVYMTSRGRTCRGWSGTASLGQPRPASANLGHPRLDSLDWP